MQCGRNLPTFWWTLAAPSVSPSWMETVGSFNKLVNFWNWHQTIRCYIHRREDSTVWGYYMWGLLKHSLSGNCSGWKRRDY